jgi:flavin-dependent dehydrogenase
MLPETTQVIIVGAGPAGLALGATLAAKQVDFVLVDRLEHGQNTSRAAAVHARTLEVLEGIDVSHRLVAAGLPVPAFVARDHDEELLTVSFADLPTRYPYVLMLPQNETETVLARRLQELGGAIHRSCEAIDLRQDEDGVAVTIRAAGAPEQTVRARYAVGADGYHKVHDVHWSSRFRSRCSRSGCSTTSACRSRRRRRCSSGPASCRPSPIRRQRGSRGGSASSTRWCTRICRQTSA